MKETEQIEFTRQRIKKIMNARKLQISKEKLRDQYINIKEEELKKKTEKAREIKEKEKLAYMTVKLHNTQKSKE